MAYFNHAFQKTFLATGNSYASDTLADPVTGGSYTISSDYGYLTTSAIPTYMLNVMSQGQKTFPYSSPTDLSTWTSGYVGIFDPKTNLSITPDQCCNIYIAGSAIYNNDKIGPFHGGYTETNKSKMINPKYVQNFYRVDPCTPQNMVLHVGSTYWTAGGGVEAGSITTPGVGYAPNSTVEIATSVTTVTGTGSGMVVGITIAAGVPTVTSIINPGKGYAVGDTVTIDSPSGVPGTLAVYTISNVTAANVDSLTGSGGASCCHEFLCGETYYLRVDIKGSPALRFLNHNAYYNAEAYTGCCPANSIAPTPVDSTEVMILWANALLRYKLVSPFIQIVIQDQQGVLWYEPGTSAAELAALGGDTWDNYVSPGYISGACAGMIFNGAYVDTKFGDCTFQVTDFYEKQPVQIYASEVDLNGDPCEFTGLCVVAECRGTQAQGLGEQVLRDLILSESYRQNFLSSNDLRIREITQGNQLISAINRNALYTKYYLLHSVPRFNNPTGVFDNDRYLLQVLSLNPLTQFETDVNTWLEDCNNPCANTDPFECVTECSAIDFPARVAAPTGNY
jgi:hypothetical protein